jgi:hypothetical protein
MTSQLNINEYSEKAFVVRGDTKPYKDNLLNRRGKWNPNLKGGAGWIFSKRHLPTMKLFVDRVNRGMTPTPVLKKPTKLVDIPTPSRKRKAEETVRERYERKLRKEWEDELESKMENKATENKATEYQGAFQFPSSGALLGDHPNFSMEVNNGKCMVEHRPDTWKLSRKRISLNRYFITMVFIATVLAISIQMDYVHIPEEVTDWVSTKVEIMRSINGTHIRSLLND